ncbi:MAG: 23S rRNA (adenine(2503)-C(2))-methyltransferase RlmN [Candidatus Aureabacteria bacterium]|nr:23S rRNA (adenine(2503)-C(2))-methyltransferase RlmN [Candidatus Auribacterota bacterium]
MQSQPDSISVLGITYTEFLEHFIRVTGKKDHYARPLYRQIMAKGIYDLKKATAEFSSSNGFKEKIFNSFDAAPLLSCEQEWISENTKKIVFTASDGRKIESVLVPMKTYKTLCVSSQIGCVRKCIFCETGRNKLIRNLSAGEIVSQMYYVKHILKEPVRNIVFMGMGEPLDNFDAVIQSIRVLNDRFGLSLPMGHITVSTAGIINKINELRTLNWKKLRLAVSLNACTDELRNRLMPVNKTYPLADLKACLKEYPLHQNGVILLGYVLIKGINDSLNDAERLVSFCRGLKVRVNLIPYNPCSSSDFQIPDPLGYNVFYEYLIQNKIHVITRRSKGSSIMAGCGQLGKNA